MPARRILQLGDPLLRAVSTAVGTPAEAAGTGFVIDGKVYHGNQAVITRKEGNS